jgi:hypothetical protein
MEQIVSNRVVMKMDAACRDVTMVVLSYGFVRAITMAGCLPQCEDFHPEDT